MNIVISGYGKMGREIEKIALARGHSIAARLDHSDDWQVHESMIRQADVVIEFSAPAAVLGNIRRCFDLHLPVVVGTTGWQDAALTVKKWCRDEEQAIFSASNFSIGVNILFSLTRHLSSLLNRFDEYDISLEEVHHIHKLDAPSGTAIKIAEIITANIDRKNCWVNHEPDKPEELQIISVREDEVPGIHTITCESDADRLILKHEAKSRKGFAIGALLAAEWLPGKHGFFEMKDLLHLAE
jgi:4-hydroxy-tetrahydrodipicolinate reductase